MIYLSTEVVIRRRPELVWSVLADPLAYPSWIEGLREVEPLGEKGELLVDASFDIVFRADKKPAIHATTTVSRARAPSLIALETRIRDAVVLFDRIELHPDDAGTRVVATSELAQDPGPLRILHRPYGLLGSTEPTRGPQRVYERSFRALVQVVEARTAAPYR